MSSESWQGMWKGAISNNRMRLKVWPLAFLTVFLLWFPRICNGQSTAQLKLSAANVDAGEPLSAELTLDAPATCATGAVLQLQMPEDLDQYLVLEGRTAQGQREVQVSVRVARDRTAGTYHTRLFQLFPCPGYDKSIQLKPPTIPDVSVTVRAIPDPTVYPTRAEITLSVTQKQFFDTKIAELAKLDQQLTTTIERKAADLPELRALLVRIVRIADHDLTITEGQYRDVILKSKDGPLPVFFAEFHHQYGDLVTQLKAPPPGVGRVGDQGQARLIYVQQLKNRAPYTSNVLPHNSTGFYPMVVTAVRKTLSDNQGAYNYIKDTGRLTFEVDLKSTPTGAQIFYKKAIDEEYMPFSGRTDIHRATLELATWNFKFHLDGCQDQFYPVNPFNEQHPEASVEFPQGCHRPR